MMYLMIYPLFIGTTELLLIGGMALLLFGGKKLPEMMRGLGQGMREFKKGMGTDAADEHPAENSQDETTRDEADYANSVVNEGKSDNDGGRKG